MCIALGDDLVACQSPAPIASLEVLNEQDEIKTDLSLSENNFFRVAFYADGVNVRGRKFGSYSQLINRFTQPV